MQGHLTMSPFHSHTGCACSSNGLVAAIGGFIGGVLLTTAIGGVVAVAVFIRIKRELPAIKK